MRICIGTISSVGRAPPRQGEGRRFDSYIVHQFSWKLKFPGRDAERVSMRIIDWIRSRASKPGTTSGERLAECARNHFRAAEGLPEQRDSLFIDLDGTESYHDIDLQRNGEPHGEVRIGLFVKDGEPPQRKVYEYSKTREDGWLIYVEV